MTPADLREREELARVIFAQLQLQWPRNFRNTAFSGDQREASLRIAEELQLKGWRRC